MGPSPSAPLPRATISTIDRAVLAFVLTVAGSLILSFVCSLSEAVLLSIRAEQIERLGDSPAGRILRQFKQEIDVPIAAILVLSTIANTTGAALAGAVYGEIFDPSTLWIFSAAFTLTILLFTEITPKTLGVAFAGQLAGPVAIGVRVLTVVLYPVLFITRGLSRWLRRGPAAPVTSLEEIRLLAALGRTEGAVLPGVAQIIEGATGLRKLRARDVMVPRTSVRVLSGQLSLEENLAIVRRTGHSRFPYSPSGSLDDVTGIVLVKDLLFHLYDGAAEPDWKRLLGRPIMVPAATPLDQLLLRFQTDRRHMALVLDEYGGTQGLVTMEDVLEEIVGEIEDETDKASETVTPGEDGLLICSGRTEARKVLDAFAVKAEPESLSIGGVVADLVGRVPQRGDRVRLGSLELEVLHASPRRAERIAVRRVGSEAPSTARLTNSPAPGIDN
jgi:CBS domain containing-hemolysin-like protein